MRIFTNDKKHYYVFQNGKKIGTIKKKKDLNVNNNSPILIRSTSRVWEFIFYITLAVLTIICLIFNARPIALVLLLLGCNIINPFDLNRKTDFYIPRPTGTMELTYNFDFKTNANVILKKRFQFIYIRFGCLMAFLHLFWVVLIEFFLKSDQNALWYLLIGLFFIVYVWAMYMSIKTLLRTVANHKLELEEQEKILKKS